MNPALHDNTWIGCGTSLLWDADALKRHVAWERQPEKLWSARPAAQNGNHAEKSLALLRETLEPMLQRELEHRGLSKGSRGYEARLIGWVEAKVPLSG